MISSLMLIKNLYKHLQPPFHYPLRRYEMCSFWEEENMKCIPGQQAARKEVFLDGDSDLFDGEVFAAMKICPPLEIFLHR